MANRNRWGDISYDLIKTDMLLPKFSDRISMGPAGATDFLTSFLKVSSLVIENVDPQIFGSSGETQVTLAASNAGKVNMIASATGLPADFVVSLPSGAAVATMITTGNTSASISYGDAVQVSLINFATVSGHFLATGTADSLVPADATEAGIFTPNTISKFTYIMNPTSTPPSAVILGDIGISRTNLPIVGSVTIGGSLTFTANTYASPLSVYYYATDGGAWGNAFATVAQNVTMSRVGNLVTVTATTSMAATIATQAQTIYSHTLPAWLRPAPGDTNGGIDVAAPWQNESAGTWNLGVLSVGTDGTLSMRPQTAGEWSVGTQIRLGNWTVSYNI